MKHCIHRHNPILLTFLVSADSCSEKPPTKQCKKQYERFAQIIFHIHVTKAKIKDWGALYRWTIANIIDMYTNFIILDHHKVIGFQKKYYK